MAQINYTNEIKDLIVFLENENIPTVERVIKNLTDILDGARLNRLNCLHAKSIGVHVNWFGAKVGGMSLVAVPLIGGLFLPISGLMIGLGTATNVGTSIVDSLLQNIDLYKLKRNITIFSEIREALKTRLNGIPAITAHLERTKDLNEDVDKFTLEKIIKKNYLSQVLDRVQMDTSLFYKDEPITAIEIRPGDHIYRPLSKMTLFTHHGVCLGEDRVVDFGSEGISGRKSEAPAIRSVAEFLEGGEQIFRRSYIIHEVSLPRTIALAERIISENLWPVYDLVTNNCELFATFLKIDGEKWSAQSAYFINKGVDLVKNATTVINPQKVGLNILKGIAKAHPALPPPPPPSMIARVKDFFRPGSAWASKTAVTVSTVSISAKILGPVMNAVDMASLCYDAHKTQPNIKAVEKALQMMLNELDVYKLYLEVLRRLTPEDRFL